MSIDNQFMRCMIDMNILTEYHDFILVTKQRCDFLKRHALRLRKENPCPYGTEAGYDDEDLRVSLVSIRVGKPSDLWSYQEELPSNVRKGRRCRLQIHEIGEGDSGDSECDALGAEVVGKDFAVEDDAGDVDAAAVEEEEDVAIVRVRFCVHGLGKERLSCELTKQLHPSEGRQRWAQEELDLRTTL
jgi:hypothetical protein